MSANKKTKTMIDKAGSEVDQELGHETGIVPVTEFKHDLDAARLPVITPDAASAAMDYAEENNPYNVWKPVPGERRLVYLIGGERVFIEAQKRDAFIAIFLDATTRKKFRVFLSDYVLKEFHEREVTKHNTLISLKYEGKMPSKKTGMSDPNKWQRYYFKPEEVARLFGSR